MIRSGGLFVLAALGLIGACSAPQAQEKTAAPAPPAWLLQALASTNLGGIEPEIVDRAGSDPAHVDVISAHATGRTDLEAFHLHWLVVELDRAGASPRYLDLARRMHAADPAAYGATLAALAESRPFAETERELLQIAFDPRTDTSSRAWRHSRAAAASTLVRRLAFDVRDLPRALPEGSPALIVDASDRWAACPHHALRVAYAQGDPVAEASAAEACLEGPNALVNDHDAAECRTVIHRVMQRPD